jgi:hypothetical protein
LMSQLVGVGWRVFILLFVMGAGAIIWAIWVRLLEGCERFWKGLGTGVGNWGLGLGLGTGDSTWVAPLIWEKESMDTEEGSFIPGWFLAGIGGWIGSGFGFEQG